MMQTLTSAHQVGTGAHGSSRGSPTAQLPGSLAASSRAVPLGQRGLSRCGIAQLWVTLEKRGRGILLKRSQIWVCLFTWIHAGWFLLKGFENKYCTIVKSYLSVSSKCTFSSESVGPKECWAEWYYLSGYECCPFTRQIKDTLQALHNRHQCPGFSQHFWPDSAEISVWKSRWMGGPKIQQPLLCWVCGLHLDMTA